MTDKPMNIEDYYDIRKSITAQNYFVVNNSVQRLVSYNGDCPRCKRNVYEVHYWVIRGHRKQEVRKELGETASGHSIRKATEELIENCPHCHLDFTE